MQLTTLSINNNEVGAPSASLVSSFLPKAQTLRLIDLKGTPHLLLRCLPLLASADDLSTLVISGNNLSVK